MNLFYSRNTLGLRGIRRSQRSVLGGWQNCTAIYLPLVSIIITYGPITPNIKTTPRMRRQA